MINQETARR